MYSQKLARAIASFLFLVVCSTRCGAQIYIGQTAGFTGSAASGVKEMTDGAKLYLGYINASGGIDGQKIELISLDDKFDPALAAENARHLVADRGVIALFLTRGTPHTQAVLPVLAQYHIALVAPSTGAMILHTPVNPYVFNVRASYQREAEKAAQFLATVSLSRIGIFESDDSFGADAIQGALKGLGEAKIEPAFVEAFDREKPDLGKMVATVAKTDPQAVIFIGSANTVAEGIKAMRKAGSRAQVVTLSNNASGGFIKSLGAFGPNTIVSQVFPFERSLGTPIVKEAIVLASTAGRLEITPAVLEGFAAAKVLVAGLRQAGPNPNREKLLIALNGLHHLDIGGMVLSYSPSNHTGLTFSDLAIIGSQGKFVR
jgi:branched-chain amino acid transport system substrate-binding protein